MGRADERLGIAAQDSACGLDHVSRRPDTFIVGAPKAGTTSLYAYLEGHPDVFMSPVKEPGYFAPDVIGGSRKTVYGEDADRYLALFADARNEKRVSEASTRYLVSPRAPSLISDFQPAPRIIVMLRNPIDVIESVEFGLMDAIESGTSNRHLPSYHLFTISRASPREVPSRVRPPGAPGTPDLAPACRSP